MDATRITTQPGGWHTATIDARSAATNVARRVQVRWRTQTHRCHGQTWGAADGDHLPCWIEATFGDVRPAVSRCGNCGSSKAWRFTTRPA